MSSLIDQITRRKSQQSSFTDIVHGERGAMVLRVFEEKVYPFLDKMPEIQLNAEESAWCEDLAARMTERKRNEVWILEKDSLNVSERFLTGILGEFAVGKLLDRKVVDETIGICDDHAVPDLQTIGIRVGVKTCRYNMTVPLVKKDNPMPQVICMVKQETRSVVIGGLAMPKVLDTYLDDSLVFDRGAIKRGTKSAFYGFDQLIQFNSIDELLNAYQRWI